LVKTLQNELERFADLLDACGKGGNRGLGLSICLGDEDSYNEAILLEKEYKQQILNELLNLEKNGFLEKKSFKYFYSNKSSIGGVIGGIAINYMLDNKKPLFSIVRKEDELHISCRGTQFLVANGLDLGLAMKKVALNLNGNGGGHKIAAGAGDNMKISCNVKIDYENEKETNAILNSIEVDNLNYIQSKKNGKTLVTRIESDSISSLIHTLDDYLACVSIAEKIIKKK